MTPTPEAIVQAIQEELDEIREYGGKVVCIRMNCDTLQDVWRAKSFFLSKMGIPLCRVDNNMKAGYFRIDQ